VTTNSKKYSIKLGVTFVKNNQLSQEWFMSRILRSSYQAKE